MSETKYTCDQIEAIRNSDPFFKKSAIERYAEYKSKDPFPNVGEALLNSVDLLMYLLTVGIVEPFDVDKLKGVTYECTFSGEAHQFDPKTSKMKEINLNTGEELILEQNSITYLKIEETFRVPEYMVLRFNLSVSNAYKGVLLGTGPIVDPGFEGNLFIPLHNLTGNKYVIKKGASLIRVEFTKLSGHIDWNNKKKVLFPQLNPITKSTPQNANFSEFINKALFDPKERKFYTSGDVVSVRSSIPDTISSAANQAKQAQESAKDAENKVNNIMEKLKKWSIIGIIGTVLAVAGLIVSVYSLIHDTNSRYDSIAEEVKESSQQINMLEQQIEMLQEKTEQ